MVRGRAYGGQVADRDDQQPDADLHALFEALVSDPALDDLRGLEPLLDDRDPDDLTDPRRRRPHQGALVLVVRAELEDDGARVWRDLQLSSDLSLETLHAVLQAAFGWEDRHLYRFSLAGDAFDIRAEWFLCPFDVEEGDDDGAPVDTVLLGETLQDRGDVLHYLYDYGEAWSVRLTVRSAEPVEHDETPDAARCLGGVGAAPAEDSRSSPAPHGTVPFDAAAVDDAVVGAAEGHDLGHLDPRLAAVVTRLLPTPLGDEVTVLVRSAALATEPEVDELVTAFAPVHWLLDRAAARGLPLTAKGYLKPAEAAALGDRLPTMRGWPGRVRREADAQPVLGFRTALQDVGLLREVAGHLEVTAAGTRARHDPDFLLHRLGRRLVGAGDGFVTQTRLLLALGLASGVTGDDTGLVTHALDVLGWGHADGAPVTHADVAPERQRLWLLLAALDPAYQPLSARPRALGAVARAVAASAIAREA